MKHIPSPSLRRLKRSAVPAARLILSFLLTAARLSGGYAPFSLALVAAAGPGLPGLLCLAGTGGGSLLFLDFQSGLRHFAAAILIFAANTAFCDTRFARSAAFRPAAGCFMTLLVQSVYLLHRSAEQWMWCLASLAVLAWAAWCWRQLWQRPDQGALLLAAAALAVAARPVTLLGPMSAGRVLASALSLWAALELSPVRAFAAAAGAGLLLDMAIPGPRLLLMAVCGCAAGLTAPLRRLPRVVPALAFCLVSAAGAILFRADVPGAVLYESATACALLLPFLRRLPRPARLIAPAETAPPAASVHLRQSAAAFRELYDSFFRGTSPAPPENPSVLFDRAAEQVCRDCVLCSSCWHRNYTSTYNAFNDACPALLQRGAARAGDFPLYFSSRCVRFSELLSAINGELRAFLLRRQYSQRLLAVRRQAQEQYQQRGEALASSAVRPAAAVAAPMEYLVGKALLPREGEQLCGDCLDSFDAGPTLYLLLADGMGSGEDAHRESSMTARLLRQFLLAGIDPVPALKTLNDALRLRAEDGGGFTTIDLLSLRRDTGAATLYKYGAAPSYVRHGASVSRVTGRGLPAGLQDAPPEVTRLQLRPGGFLVMISDGVAGESDDAWLQDLLLRWPDRDADALAARILDASRSRGGADDDRAVLVLHLPVSGENRKTQV